MLAIGACHFARTSVAADRWIWEPPLQKEFGWELMGGRTGLPPPQKGRIQASGPRHPALCHRAHHTQHGASPAAAATPKMAASRAPPLLILKRRSMAMLVAFSASGAGAGSELRNAKMAAAVVGVSLRRGVPARLLRASLRPVRGLELPWPGQPRGGPLGEASCEGLRAWGEMGG